MAEGQTQVSTAPKPNKQGNDNKAIAALVLGILSIFLCFFTVLGITLGILAIVFAALSRKESGKSGLATGGLVTGIVGVALNVLLTIMLAVIMGFLLNLINDSIEDGTFEEMFNDSSIEELLEDEGIDSDLFSDSFDGEDESDQHDGDDEYHHGVKGYTGELKTQDEQDAYQAAESALENVADPSDSTIEALGSYFDELFDEGAGVSMSDCGVDPEDFASWVVADATCEIDDVEVEDGVAYVYYTTHVRNADNLLERASQNMQEYSNSEDYSSDSLDDRKEKIGEIILDAMDEEPETAIGGGVIVLEKFNDTWALTSDSQDMLPNDFYNVTWSL